MTPATVATTAVLQTARSAAAKPLFPVRAPSQLLSPFLWIVVTSYGGYQTGGRDFN
jgi:hypothetical protein